MPFPYIFTFYSYKGGVGRSLALLNVAYTLAGRGRHVLVVDMDLEAPGISGFLHRQEELAAPAAGHPMDVLGLLGEAIAALRAGGTLPEAARGLPLVIDHVWTVPDRKLAALKPRLGQLGRLDVLGTDLERDYLERLAELRLKDLRQDELVALSGLLHQYFKAQRFLHRPLGLEAFEAPLPTCYDYVLVDSRTGITEIGGLCVGPLADRLVVITSLNDQNVQGTLSFMNEVGIKPERRPPDGERWDEADTGLADGAGSPSLGPKPTILIASPVPSGEIGYKRARLEELEKLLGVRPASLSYHPQMALIESVFVRDYPEEYLAAEYGRLSNNVMEQVGDDAQNLATKSGRLWAEEKLGGAAITCVLRLAPQEPGLAVVLLRQLGEAISLSSEKDRWAMRQLLAHLSQVPTDSYDALLNWGKALSLEAKTETGQEAERLFEEAGRKYAEALRQKPDSYDALLDWGNTLLLQAKTGIGQEADRLFEAAGRSYAEAHRLQPSDHVALNNWGCVLYEQAKRKKGQEAAGLFEEAGRRFAEALQVKPAYSEALINRDLVLFELGVVLAEQAKSKTGEDADRLFREAARRFDEAAQLRPDSFDVLTNWGVVLSEQAKRKTGDEADRLFREAAGRHAQALKLKPDSYEALSNWGRALAEQAMMKTGEEAGQLFEAAGRKYEDAVRLKPDFQPALYGWGIVILERAKTRAGEEADRLFEEAGRKYAEALRLKPDDYAVLHNWGLALLEQAKMKAGEEAGRLFEEAGSKYAEALRLKPDSYEALNNWGAALAGQAKTKTGEEADRLFEKAGCRFAEAVRLRHDAYGALSNCGLALFEQAKTKAGEEADRLFEEAGSKYAEALRLKPDDRGVLNNWGLVLLEQSKRKTGQDAGRPLRQAAREKFLEAERLRAGAGSYNLACLEAVDGRASEAVRWLRAHVSYGERLTRAQIAAGADFEGVRGQPDFAQFVDSLPQR